METPTTLGQPDLEKILSMTFMPDEPASLSGVRSTLVAVVTGQPKDWDQIINSIPKVYDAISLFISAHHHLRQPARELLPHENRYLATIVRSLVANDFAVIEAFTRKLIASRTLTAETLILIVDLNNMVRIHGIEALESRKFDEPTAQSTMMVPAVLLEDTQDAEVVTDYSKINNQEIVFNLVQDAVNDVVSLEQFSFIVSEVLNLLIDSSKNAALIDTIILVNSLKNADITKLLESYPYLLTEDEWVKDRIELIYKIIAKHESKLIQICASLVDYLLTVGDDTALAYLKRNSQLLNKLKVVPDLGFHLGIGLQDVAESKDGIQRKTKSRKFVTDGLGIQITETVEA